MRRLKCAWIAGCGLCLLLAGCGQAAQPAVSVSSVPGTESGPASEVQKLPGSSPIVSSSSFSAGSPGEDLAGGKARISYSGNESTVRYITSASQLPDNEELAKYDDAYFEDHALVLVTETVNSGSIDVGIESIQSTDQGNSVVLSHSAPDRSQATTDDMATWLLWAEVNPGLEGSWTVENPAMPSSGTKY